MKYKDVPFEKIIKSLQKTFKENCAISYERYLAAHHIIGVLAEDLFDETKEINKFINNNFDFKYYDGPK